jgi:hypothetical protein
MAAFQLQPGERLLINDPHAKWIMMEMKAVEGRLRITQNRVVFEKPEHAYFNFLKFMIKSLGAEIIFEIRRSDITAVSKAEAGKTARLKIETKAERPKMFETMKMDTIVGELNKTITKPG